METPTFARAARLWAVFGCVTFGGPAAQIALMHSELVERRRWISAEEFTRALGFCFLLPGPEAQQLATYIGWHLHGTRGAIVAGTLFVLPSALLLWALSVLYVLGGGSPIVAGFFSGLLPVVVALVILACVRLARRATTKPASILAATLAFLAFTFFHTPFPLVLLLAAGVGYLLPSRFTDTVAPTVLLREPRTSTLRPAAIAAALWLIPVILLVVLERGLLARLAVFFSATSVMSFGGAYAILPYVAQSAVSSGWLTPDQMLAGLGLAETTPGPLIIVLQFVGFVAAWNQPGTLPPLLAATLGALVATWTTFLPSFVWIFLGAPHVHRIQNHVRLASALAAVSAVVVGMMASLAFWMATHILVLSSGGVDVVAAAICLLVLVSHRLGALPLVLIGGVLGVARAAFTI